MLFRRHVLNGYLGNLSELPFLIHLLIQPDIVFFLAEALT